MKKRILALLLALCMIFALSACDGNSDDNDEDANVNNAIESCKSIVEDFYDALRSGTGEDVYEASNVEAFFDLLIEEGEWDDDDFEGTVENIIDYYDDYCDDGRDKCKDEFGDDWSYEMEITESKELKVKDFNTYEELIEDYYDIEVDIEEGYIVTYKYTFEGEDGDYSSSGEFDVLKINGEWIIGSSLYWGSWYAA